MHGTVAFLDAAPISCAPFASGCEELTSELVQRWQTMAVYPSMTVNRAISDPRATQSSLTVAPCDPRLPDNFDTMTSWKKKLLFGLRARTLEANRDGRR